MNKTLNLLIFTIILCVNLYAKDEIVWFQNQRPPWMINSGEFKNTGYGDKIRQHFESVLSEYDHKLIPINPSRFFKEMNNYNKLCYGPLMKIKSLKNNFHWSNPIYAIPKQEIIVLESTFEELGSPKEISIEELLKNENYIFGKLANLNHYPIKKFEHQKNILTISTMASTRNLLNMMQKKRIDWIYDFPLYIKWHTMQSGNIINENYKTIEVKETKQNNKIIAHMICKKNDFGKKIIEKINKNLSKDNILKIRSLVRQWQPNNEDINTFNNINKEIFDF